ncbi:ABC transporter ATP-binding protein [Amphibiibacter pelophylacis]|uniref:ABC transporter ATP-binding protein n=1 Tax=Amphibiibacter pelophylacis TaxID=1799477 RepID=A0ACC6NY19_9BURK
MDAPKPPAVELRQITKRFGSVLANDAVDLSVPAGSIQGIVGENGAGKSTLMSILYGFYTADSGEILLHGQPVRIRQSTDAIAQGVGMVHQHFMLVDTLTGLDNVILGAEQHFFLRKALPQARRLLEEIMARFHLSVRLDTRVEDMPVGEQQRLEILKALYRKARVLILDEPTGVLTPQEALQLFAVLRELRAQGVTVIIITHKLKEILDITDNVTVMRGGRVVAHRPTRETSFAELAELMVGRKANPHDTAQAGRGPSASGPVRLSVQGLTLKDNRGVTRLHDLSFDVHAGEILGVAGVSGNGQTELLAALSGLAVPQAGTLTLTLPQAGGAGTPQRYTPDQWVTPTQLRRMGCAHVPEDRIAHGLVKSFAMQETAVLGYHDDAELGSAWRLSPARIRERTMEIIGRFDVRPSVPGLRTADMSGGNQQKLVMGREMMRDPHLLLIGQPTRGVDIGAIELIYAELMRARKAGAAILLVSVELEEIFTLSDRILVMNGGHITGLLRTAETDIGTVGQLMAEQHSTAA